MYKQRKKSIARDKNLNDTFYLIFLTQTLTLRHFKLFEKLKKSTLLKLKTLKLSRKLNQTKLISKAKG
jgi:hypothetical protein